MAVALLIFVVVLVLLLLEGPLELDVLGDDCLYLWKMMNERRIRTIIIHRDDNAKLKIRMEREGIKGSLLQALIVGMVSLDAGRRTWRCLLLLILRRTKGEDEISLRAASCRKAVVFALLLARKEGRESGRVFFTNYDITETEVK